MACWFRYPVIFGPQDYHTSTTILLATLPGPSPLLVSLLALQFAVCCLFCRSDTWWLGCTDTCATRVQDPPPPHVPSVHRPEAPPDSGSFCPINDPLSNPKNKPQYTRTTCAEDYVGIISHSSSGSGRGFCGACGRVVKVCRSATCAHLRHRHASREALGTRPPDEPWRNERCRRATSQRCSCQSQSCAVVRASHAWDRRSLRKRICHKQL